VPLFGKKEDKTSGPNAPFVMSGGSPPTNVPIEQVINLRKQGISNSQIVEMLQRDGYKTHQIFEAMNQADLKAAVVSKAVPEDFGVRNPIPEFGQAGDMPQFSGFNEAGGKQNIPRKEMPEQDYEEDVYQQPEAGIVGTETTIPGNMRNEEIEKIEEISEAIINEKWNEFIINVNKIIAWKERTEARMKALEERFEDLRASFSELQKALLGKVEEYDRHINDVGTEIKAMEKIFQKVLPSFTANINELSRITEDIKESKKR